MDHTRVEHNPTAGQGHVCLTSVIKWELDKHSIVTPHPTIKQMMQTILTCNIEQCDY